MSEGPKCFQYGFECDELDNACSKIKDLERQLEEAKRKNKSLEKLIEGIILGSREARDLLNQTFVNYNEQLKEKG
jgi:hypothetical protein